MSTYSQKKPERNYHQCHAAMLGALMAIHSLESNFPKAVDFWNGQLFLQYQGVQ